MTAPAARPVDAPPLRIAHFTLGRCNPESANGIDKTVYHLARAQAELGHAVRVFSLTHKSALPIPGVTVRVYPPHRRPATWRHSRLGEILVSASPFHLPAPLVRDVLDWHPHVLHLHFVHAPPNIWLARRARRDGIPYCVTLHGGLSPAARARHGWRKRMFAALVERRHLRDAAFVHVIDPREAEGLREYGVHAATVLAPNGVDVAALSCRSDPRALETLAPWLRGRRIFLFLGRLDPEQKGLDLLLRGVAASGSTDAGVVLAGPDWRDNRARLEALAEELGIAERTAFVGPMFGERKLDLFAAADIFVHTSRWEGLSFSVLEAAACGKPALLTPPADPGGVFARSGAAIAVFPDVESVSAGVRRCLDLSPSELHAMGRRARAVVERDFQWAPSARTLVDAYRAHAVAAHG
jgi:poly(glycerol-phosphate) alpha-glucosyltransferase